MNNDLKEKLISWNSLCALLVVSTIGFVYWCANYKSTPTMPTPIPSTQAEYVPQVAPPMTTSAPVQSQSQPVQNYEPAPQAASQPVAQAPEPHYGPSQAEINRDNEISRQNEEMARRQYEFEKKQQRQIEQQNQAIEEQNRRAKANEMNTYICRYCGQSTTVRVSDRPHARGCTSPKCTADYHGWDRQR